MKFTTLAITFATLTSVAFAFTSEQENEAREYEDLVERGDFDDELLGREYLVDLDARDYPFAEFDAREDELDARDYFPSDLDSRDYLSDDLEAREEELDARDYYDELDAREYFDELDARDYFPEDLDAREQYDELDAREYVDDFPVRDFSDQQVLEREADIEARGRKAKKVENAVAKAKAPVKLIADGVQLAVAAASGNEVGAVIDAIKLTIDGIVMAFKKLSAEVKQDNINRGAFTKGTISTLRQKHPKYNFVMCHTKHTKNFAGTEGKDWYHDHREFDIKVGGTIGFEIYGFTSGEFTRKGDGGWQNWAYDGKITKTDQKGKHLVFSKP